MAKCLYFEHVWNYIVINEVIVLIVGLDNCLKDTSITKRY